MKFKFVWMVFLVIFIILVNGCTERVIQQTQDIPIIEEGITEERFGDMKYLQIPDDKLQTKHIPKSRDFEEFTKFAWSILGEANISDAKYDNINKKFSESPFENPSQLDRLNLTELRVMLFKYQRSIQHVGGGISVEDWRNIEYMYEAIRKKLSN
ncbi:hypothetical protein HYY73_04575 [Candidatus Woesearchaeota archaeon]|nr:hypothetical protein [Candidatus Woesearchaeota archaeon]